MHRTRSSSRLAAIGVVALAAVATTAGTAQADQPSLRTATLEPSKAHPHRAWTAARMRKAKPAKMPAVRSSRAGQVLHAAPDGAGQPIAGRRSGGLPRRSKSIRRPHRPDPRARAAMVGHELPWQNNSYGYTTAAKPTGRLYFNLADGSPNVCSASVVATNVIVTAAHCVEDADGADHDGFMFIPGKYGSSEPYGRFYAKTNGVSRWDEWSTAPYNCSDGTGCGGYLGMDYAFITLKPNSLGYNVGQYTGWYGLWPNAPKGNMYVLGYPAEGTWSQYQDYPWHCSSMPQQWNRYAYEGRYDVGLSCYDTGGASGGPWLMTYNGGTYVASVMSHMGVVHQQDPSCFIMCARYGLSFFGPYFDNDTIRLFNYAKTK